MSFINIELKARTKKADLIREYLLNHQAEFKGIDQQTDTYFKVMRGRLKLRQGNIESSLVYYERPDQLGPKQSDCRLIEIAESGELKEVLTKAIGVLTVVKKSREIFYIKNVKFHIDQLNDLGTFVEIEASDKNEPIPVNVLIDQCNFYKKAFGIEDEDLINLSYSDMILKSQDL